VGLKWNETYHLLVYAPDVNLLGDNINTIKKNEEALIYFSKEVGLDVNTEKTISIFCCFINRMLGKNHNIKVANRSTKNAAKFKYFRLTATNQNLMDEEIKNRLIPSNACYSSVQKLLSSHPCLKS
jgi:hypothetical protein